MGFAANRRYMLYRFLSFIFTAIVIAVFTGACACFSSGGYNCMPVAPAKSGHAVPLDPASPWPKFRCDEIQSGRSSAVPAANGLKPWTFMTGKGIFSSPVIDGSGNVYIGSADHYFYAIDKAGNLKWKFLTGEIIDSSALLDDKDRVYVGSGDSFVYAFDRSNGNLVWKFKAHTPQEVTEQFGVKTYNLNWFEGNIAILGDGSILAPNDNYLIYRLNRDTGERITQYVINEMGWSLPAVNASTGRIVTGSNFLAIKNVYCFDTKTGKKVWTNGGLGTNAASVLLTNDTANGLAIVGGFDGILRAFSQKNGRQVWKFNARDHFYASPAQMTDGTIIQAGTDGSVYALDPKDGKAKWSFDTLAPIRSSPAIDGAGNIYFGAGDGRLYCLNPDGTLRWAYRFIMDVRDDINGSPALGNEGVCVAGENGGIFFMPYDYPLSAEGRKDPCSILMDESLPAKGEFLLYMKPFGGLNLKAPDKIRSNEPVAFTLYVRRNGETVKSAIDRKSVKVTVEGGNAAKTDISANDQFITILPQEQWTGPEGGTISVNIKGDYKTGQRRFGLKFYGGKRTGSFDQTFTFTIPPRNGGQSPFAIPAKPGDPSSTIELSRLAPAYPSILPSYNQIGYDSLHYVLGAVEGTGDNAVLWGIGGKLTGDNITVINPELKVRFPLMLNYDRGVLTLYNYDGMLLDMNGSWAMPLALFRVSTDTAGADATHLSELSAIAECDKIKFYGHFLKLMGMSEFKTGHMNIYGGINYNPFGTGISSGVTGAGTTGFSYEKGKVIARIDKGTLKKEDHVYGLLLVSEATGRPVPAKYIYDTTVECDGKGMVTGVSLSLKGVDFKGRARAYYMVDTYPVAKGTVEIK